MSSEKTTDQKTQFLLTNLLLLMVFIFIVSVGISYYVFKAMPTQVGEVTIIATQEITTMLPTHTTTPTWPRPSFPSSTPTRSLTPSPTLSPTWTLTPPGPPTLTPARPLPQPEVYRLKTWNEEQANDLVRMMEYYPYTLPQNQESQSALFYQQFIYAMYAQREALLRFPQSIFKESWEWGLAYNLARLGNTSVGERYASLIVSALNEEKTDISHLYIWFKRQEPRLDLFMVKLDDIPNFFENYLIEIRGQGSAFLWLLRGAAGFRAVVLDSYFDFVNAPSADWIYADVDGVRDNGKEVLIYYRQTQDRGVIPPYIYSLQSLPPYPLPFFPQPFLFDILMPFIPNWALRLSSEGVPQLVFHTQVFPACPMHIQRVYQWDGDNFALWSIEDELIEIPSDFSLCQLLVEHASSHWNLRSVIAIMETMLDEWPTQTNEIDVALSLERRDEWRYRLGIYSALVGEEAVARKYLQDLIEQPSLSISPWVEPARQFLQVYRSTSDVYRACVLSDLCDAGKALEYLVSDIRSSQDVLSELWKYGVQTYASGYYDFEQDKQPERWFTVRHRPLSDMELWALFTQRGGVKAIKIATIQSIQPRLELLDEAYIDPLDLHLQPAILLDHQYAFHIHRIPGSLTPYIVEVRFRKEYPNRYEIALNEAIQGLFAGQSAQSIVEKLEGLEQWPGLLCRSSWTCDAYYYFLGLARELAGDARGAIQAYHLLWSDYTRSPFTIMARVKLIPPLLTSTPTATQTLTPSATFTASLTTTLTGTVPPGTPTVTPTTTPTPSGTVTPATPTGTATMTPTATSTAEAYPPPGSATPTSSPYP